MAAPVFGNAGTYLNGGTRTSTNVDVPDNVASGDIILVFLYLESTATVTAPSGFTEVSGAASTTTPSIGRIFWKRATGSESTGGTYNFTHSSAFTEGVACRFTGCIGSGSPIDVSNSAQRSTSGTTTPAVSFTTTGVDRLLVWSATSVAIGAWTPPTAGGTWTERVDTGREISVATKSQAAAGATGSVTGTGPNERMTAFMVALLPALAPTVNGGTDATIDQYETFNRTATENDNGASITSRAWTVQSGPNQVGATIGTAAALSWAPTVGGTYVLRYSATNSVGTGTDDVTVTVNSLNFPVTAALVLSATRTGAKNVPVSRTAPLVLSATRTGAKAVSVTRTAPLVLSASVVGHVIHPVSANIVLHTSIETSSSQGAFVTAMLKLHGSSTTTKQIAGITRTAPIRLFGARTVTSARSGAPSAPLVLHGSSTGTKAVPVAVNALLRLAASIANRAHHSVAARTALIKLHGAVSGESTVRSGFDQVVANVVLHGSGAASSVRFMQNVSANLVLHATAFTQRVVVEAQAIRARADTTTKYLLVAVARIPQISGPPIFAEVDPIDWTTIDWTEALNEAPTLSTSVKIDKLTEPILQRLRNPDELPTELWLFRNGKQVFAGPLLGGRVSGDSISLEGAGIESYTRWFYVTIDLDFNGTDQFWVTRTLIDQWQVQEYGHFGIVTASDTLSGVPRTISYPYQELHIVSQRIDDLTKMANGFNWWINPASRRLEMASPQRGVDRSTGVDAIIFDQRNVTSDDLMFSISPGDLASDALGTGSDSSSDTPLVSTFGNSELRAKFGRIGIVGNFQTNEQAALDQGVQELVNTRREVLLVPGPEARVTLDADLSLYDIGDIIGYRAHGRLAVAGSYRIRKRSVKINETGRESVSIEFV